MLIRPVSWHWAYLRIAFDGGVQGTRTPAVRYKLDGGEDAEDGNPGVWSRTWRKLRWRV
jgi:hypothetical protein